MLKEFAQKDQIFKIACEMAGVDNTPRQASKFCNRKGRAYLFHRDATAKYNADIREKARQKMAPSA